MRLLIITGMSGAGKSSVLKMLEDAGYFCIDNPPIQLIHKFVQLTHNANDNFERVAMGIDIRSGEGLDELEEVFEQIKVDGYKYEILFLDASTDVLVKRYKETRRSHPLSGVGRVDAGIELEREKLDFIKKRSDIIIDTSQLLIRELKAQIDNIYVENASFKNLNITILSFGFKYGIPIDSDLVFDVRFLPNPYYLPELKLKTGNDAPVQEYVLDSPKATAFLDKLEDMVTFLIPNYVEEGKNQLVISIGCTGGKHRSVTLANKLYERLQNLDYGLKIEHRDIEKDARR